MIPQSERTRSNPTNKSYEVEIVVKKSTMRDEDLAKPLTWKMKKFTMNDEEHVEIMENSSHRNNFFN